MSAVYGGLISLSTNTTIEYNPVTQTLTTAKLYTVNATANSGKTQTVVHTNASQLYEIPTLELDATISNPIKYYMRMNLNTTFLEDTELTTIVIRWYYVGQGNLTEIILRQEDPSVTWIDYGDVEAEQPGSNETLTFTPETFQVAQIVACTNARFTIMFDDPDYLPKNNEYLSWQILFYETSSSLSRVQLLQMIAIFGGALFMIAAVASTRFWNPG